MVFPFFADGSSVGPLNVGTGVEGRFLASHVVLDDGAFAVIGGVTPLGTGKSDILYFNPDDSSLSVSSTDLGALSVHGAAGVLPNGTIAVTGGYGNMGIPNTDILFIENLTATTGAVEAVTPLGELLSVRYGGSLVAIDDEELIYFGGIDVRFVDEDNYPVFGSMDVQDSVVPLKSAEHMFTNQVVIIGR